MTKACIVGWAHTPFGKLEDPDVESLIARVSGEALIHAGVGHHQLDVPVQVDRAMHLRLDLGIEHATRLAGGWVPPRLRKFFEDIQQASDGQVWNP